MEVLFASRLLVLVTNHRNGVKLICLSLGQCAVLLSSESTLYDQLLFDVREVVWFLISTWKHSFWRVGRLAIILNLLLKYVLLEWKLLRVCDVCKIIRIWQAAACKYGLVTLFSWSESWVSCQKRIRSCSSLGDRSPTIWDFRTHSSLPIELLEEFFLANGFSKRAEVAKLTNRVGVELINACKSLFSNSLLVIC